MREELGRFSIHVVSDRKTGEPLHAIAFRAPGSRGWAWHKWAYRSEDAARKWIDNFAAVPPGAPLLPN